MAECSQCSRACDRLSADGLCDSCLLEETIAPRSPAGTETFGAYQVLCGIGEGGIAVVYLAEQTHPIRREVALKVLKSAAGGADVLQRFEKERQLLALMDHPNIGRVLDAGVSSTGRPFFAMEFIDGEPITEFCDRRSLPIAERLKLFAAVCHAVDHAHRKGVLHRDLKPSNILVTEHDGKAAPKIIDFGIAKTLDARFAALGAETEVGQVLGTIEYMSPEQANLAHRDLGPASDVYSLGVVLYELTCGVLPLEPARLFDDGLSGALEILRETPAPSLADGLRRPNPGVEERARARNIDIADWERQISGDLEAIAAAALAKDRSRRYPSAGEFAADIERFLRRESAHAPGARFAPEIAPTSSKRSQRWTRFHLIAAVAGAAAILALMVVELSPVARHTPTLTPLTSSPGYEFLPAVSPAGDKLAFVWNGEDDNYDIYVRSLAAGEPVRLTHDPAHDLHPAWSPDGRSIAFVRVSREKSEIFTMPAGGGSERRLMAISNNQWRWEADASALGPPPGPAWSPDGRSLAVASQAGGAGPDCLYLVSPETGSTRQITFPEPAALGDQQPVFSPGGRNLAFVRAASRRGITDIYVMPAAGGEPRRVTFDQKTIYGLAWESENRLLFASNRAGGTMLWSVPATGGTPEMIAIAGRNVRSLAIAPGRRVIYTETFRNSNLWRFDLSRPGSPAERLIATTHRNDSPKYSPDGTRILFGSDRSGTYEIWVANADGSHPRQVTSSGGLPVGTPRWSPDGREVAFDGVKDGHSVIYTISAEGGPARVLVNEPTDSMMPSWSSDGRYVYFASARDNGELRVWKQPVAGGAPVQVTHLAGGEAVETPDAHAVFFSTNEGVWQVSPDGSNEHPVPELKGVHHSRYFAVTNQGAYFVRAASQPAIVQFFDFATHTISTIARIDNRILSGTPNLTISPDGRWLLYAQLDGSGSDLQMLSDFR